MNDNFRKSYENFRLVFSKRTHKFLNQLSLKQKLAFIDAFDLLLKRTERLNIKKLQGYQKLLHLRVGDYRIIFEPDTEKKIVYVHLIAHRKNAYPHLSRLKGLR